MKKEDHAVSTERPLGQLSMTKSTLELIGRFHVEERRSQREHEASGSNHQRRRSDLPAPTPSRADDLILGPARL